MNKSLAIACLAILFASASAQSVGSFCMKNGDCDQTKSLCCGGFGSSSSLTPYTQFNCVGHNNGTSSVPTHTCLLNGTDYTSVCATEDKTCVNNATKFVSCGNSIAMFAIDAANPDAVCTSSGAMTLATSAFFAVLAALALLF